MLKKVFITICALVFILSVLPMTFSAASVSVPGGNVSSYDELFSALGGEETSALKKNDKDEIIAVQIFENVEFSAPIKITSGQYVIYGAGSTISASFKEGYFFEISGEETTVIFGNPEGSTSIDITLDGKEVSRNGGFISIDNGSVVAVYGGTAFKNVITTGSGGAIYNKGELLIYGGKFEKCRAVISGGAIYNENEAVLASGTITECSSDKGGAVYSAGRSTFIGTEMTKCVADKGGAIYNASEMKYASSVITECKGRLGGAIYNENNCELLGGSISNSSAENGDGGAIYNVAELLLTAGTLDSNTAKNGGNVYNNGNLTLESNITMTSGSAQMGGNIYNDAQGKITSNGGSVSLGKADFGGGIFNRGEVLLVGGNYNANKANIAGKGVLNHGIVKMSGNGYMDPSNDFFVVLSDDNAHALHILDGWVYDRQIVKLSCGVATGNGYEYSESVGNVVLVIDDDSVIVSDRFALYNQNGLVISQSGKIANAPADNTFIYYIIGAVIAFVIVVAAIVFAVRYFDKKKSSATSADDYF